MHSNSNKVIKTKKQDKKRAALSCDLAAHNAIHLLRDEPRVDLIQIALN